MNYHDNPTTYMERLENAFLSFNREKEIATILNEIREKGYMQGYTEGIEYGHKSMKQAYEDIKNRL